MFYQMGLMTWDYNGDKDGMYIHLVEILMADIGR
jgi:hypothetical protein